MEYKTRLDELIRLKAGGAMAIAEAWPIISGMGMAAIRSLAALMTGAGAASLVAAYNSKDSSLLRDMNAGDMQIVIDKAMGLEWAGGVAEGMSLEKGFARTTDGFGETLDTETQLLYNEVDTINNSMKPDDDCEKRKQTLLKARALFDKLQNTYHSSQFLGHEDFAGGYGLLDNAKNHYEENCGKTSNWYKWADGESPARNAISNGFKVVAQNNGERTVFSSIEEAMSATGYAPSNVIIYNIEEIVSIIW